MSKKRDENVSLTRIRNRFLKVALADRSNIKRDVCKIHTEDGKEITLDPESFDELITTSPDGVSLNGVTAIQLSVLPKGGVYRNEYIRQDVVKPITSTKRVMENGTVVRCFDKSMNEALDAMTRRVVAYLENAGTVIATSSLRQRQHGEQIQKISVEYVVDSGDRIWLKSFPEVLLVERSSDSKDLREQGERDQALLSSSSSSSSSRTTKSASMPDLHSIKHTYRPKDLSPEVKMQESFKLAEQHEIHRGSTVCVLSTQPSFNLRIRQCSYQQPKQKRSS